MVLDPQELWHQGTRPSPFDPFRHATLWRSRLGATPAAAPGRCGRMPWTWLSPVEVAKSSASFITRPSWGLWTSRPKARKPLKSSCCTQSPINMSCDVMWHASFCPLTLPMAIALSIRRPLWWPAARTPMHGGAEAGPVTDARPLFCSCCITTDKTWAFASPSVVVHSRALKCFVSLWLRDVLGPLCPPQTILMRSLYRAKIARWLARCGNADRQQLPQHARERRENERPPGRGRGECAFLRRNIAHSFGSIFGCAHRQCLQINRPRSSHGGVCLARGLLHPDIGQRRRHIRRFDSTDAGDAEGGW